MATLDKPHGIRLSGRIKAFFRVEFRPAQEEPGEKGMKGFIERLCTYIGVRPRKDSGETSAGPRMVHQPGARRRRGSQPSQEKELSVEELCEATNDTVPNLEILGDPADAEEAGYDPYETTESYQWNSGNNER